MNDLQLALPGVGTDSAVEWVWIDGEEQESRLSFSHRTVMKEELVASLAPRTGGLYLDATVGGGGHAEAILRAAEGVHLLAFDRDPTALDAAQERLAPFSNRVTFVLSNFGRITHELAARGISHVDGIYADLGVSSPQLDEPSRGMSFRREGPIDMRMDPRDDTTALDLIAGLSDDELADVLYRFGDERRSRRIARSLKRAYEANDLVTTLDLRRAIVRAIGPARIGGVDPATKTFQALRIAVNRELEELETLLADVPRLLAPGAVAAFISFHSLEDRRVKVAFQRKDVWEPLTKKPRIPTEEEGTENPRSRSAKLRAARRLGDDN